MELAVGRSIPPDEVEMWREELGLDPWARGLTWQRQPQSHRLADFSVTIIGTGMGGLCAAVQLKRAGIPYRILEKNSGVGGTWFENRYPGARVDTRSRTYCHTFAIDYPFPQAFCESNENEKYFNWIADNFDIRQDIVFDTEVDSLRWDDESSLWTITAHGPSGISSYVSNAVITSVGFLNRPRLPDIEGVSDFEGESWHTARWPRNADLSGRRVALVGTGCSGYQVAPELAATAAQLTIFQRSAQWIFPLPGYTADLAPEVSWLDRTLPFYPNFTRLCAMYGRVSGVPELNIDPDFHDPFAINAENKAVRDFCIDVLTRKLGNPDLVARMTPPHPPFSARPVLVDADYSILETIQRDNVELVTEGVRRITSSGIETADGRLHEVDVIIYATGFRASDYLFPMTITGRNGLTMDEFWAKDGPRAYRGCMIPGFPNLWAIYGPNTNGGLLVPSIHEMTTAFALQCLERLILDEKQAVEVTEEAYLRFNLESDERGSRRAYSDPRNHGYYWSQYGRSTTQCNFSALEMWRLLRHPDFKDLRLT